MAVLRADQKAVGVHGRVEDLSRGKLPQGKRVSCEAELRANQCGAWSTSDSVGNVVCGCLVFVSSIITAVLTEFYVCFDFVVFHCVSLRISKIIFQ